MKKGAQQYHNRGKEQNRVEMEHGLQHLLDQFGAGHALLGQREAHHGVYDDGQNSGGAGGVDHVLDVVIQVAAGGHRGQHGGVGEGGELISKHRA